MPRSILISPVALFAAPLVALIGSAPAAARVADENIAFLAAWPAISGLVGLPVAGLIAAMRLARRSVRDRPPSSLSALLWGTAVWLAVSIPSDVVLVAILKATTHHRALGGATFATFGLVANAVAVLAGWRFTASVLPRLSTKTRKRDFALIVVLAACAFVLTCVIGAGLAAGGPADAAVGDRVQALLVDSSLTVTAIAVAALLDFPEKRSVMAWWGGAGGLALLGSIALSSIIQSPTLAQRLVQQAPFAAAIGQTVGLTGEGPADPAAPDPLHPAPAPNTSR